MKKQFYIKERLNPQFRTPYYVACGQLTKAEAKRMEETVYGHNVMLPYATEDEYKKALDGIAKTGGVFVNA